MQAVTILGAKMKFVPREDLDRALIADELMDMVNWPASRLLFRYDTEQPTLLPYVTPKARLDWLVAMLCAHVADWPGMAQVRGVFCCRFRCADGKDVQHCDLPGFTDFECSVEGVTSGLSVVRNSLPPQEPQRYLPAPDDEPIGELAEQIKTVARRGKKA